MSSKPKPQKQLQLDTPPARLEQFKQEVFDRGRELYRDLPWRNTKDPYAVLLSEIMLQQTQVSRVLGRWEEWLDVFPTVQALAAAPLPPVLELWQGMGYNRRALNLKRCAETVVAEHGGIIPSDKKELLGLPGIGPSTSAGVRAFAFELPDVYIETNVRAVFIHEFFKDAEKVDDKELTPLVETTCPQDARVRDWYYALLDYGAHLKKTQVNPSRKSKQYSRQSKFEGSHRQKRAYILRRVLEAPMTSDEIAAELAAIEVGAGRPAPDIAEGQAVLSELQDEGFIVKENGLWMCAE